MTPGSLRSFLTQLRTELELATPIPGSGPHGTPPLRVTVETRFTAHAEPDGDFSFRPVLDSGNGGAPDEGTGHRLTLEWGPREPVGRTGGGSPEDPVVSALERGRPVVAGISSGAGNESASGGDAGTLRRRLEFVLGGPPGFTRGAQAEILADLLQEFGRPALLESLRRDWISRFETDPETSASVTKTPPAAG